MKAIILAGGRGTRISEQSDIKPKPMIDIGGMPILWHILKMYSAHGINEFIICCGYKSYVIKEYFANYFLHMSDVTFDIASNSMEVHRGRAEDWKVTLVDTGENSMTGGRLKRVQKYINNDEAFCFTYGDGVSDLNITETINFHKAHGKLATVTAVQPPGRFGAIDVTCSNNVTQFQEKPVGDGSFINGGFFVLHPDVIDLIDGDDCVWEKNPLQSLAQSNQLMAFQHNGFWHPMDTMRDNIKLNELWDSGDAPWKTWRD
ncbi:glucose-1-phosphate cytidylyltransferase [Candidatus Enterovibrio escicola]|uniref:glucose-1-phosphate cytidylyltransferase n=1 Tax=Candidatus Enterovibrio escicola TaxID=1927127 RepID=UPI001237A62F|nr:glucose-1-phosphate cytidylyltransferase [Candidatus Enterovibrio escacola]